MEGNNQIVTNNDQKNNKSFLIIIVLLILIILGMGGYIVYDKVLNKPEDNKMTETNNEQPSQEETTEEQEVETVPNGFKKYSYKYESDSADVKNKLYSLIMPSNMTDVYDTKKITTNNVDKKIIETGVIIYLLNNIDGQIIYDTNNDYYVSKETLTKYAKKLYGLDNFELESTLFAGNAQSAFGTLTTIDNKDYYKLQIDTFQGDSIENEIDQHLYKNIKVNAAIYDKVETSGNYIYLYDKAIANNSIDWSDTGYGWIEKFDKTNRVEFTFENGTSVVSIEDLNKKYSEYFTNYKHTFIKDEKGQYKYVSSEPLN